VSNRFKLGKIRREENVLWSFAPHDISVILKLMNNQLPKSVRCTGQSFISKNIHDITSTILEYDNCYVQINVNWLNPFKEQLLTIVGTNGMITFDDTIEDKIRYYSNYMQWDAGQPLVNKQEGTVINYNNTNSPLYIECCEFIECCRTRKVPLTDGSEGMRVLNVLESAHKSLLNDGSRVKLDINKSSMNYTVHPSSYVDNKAIIGRGTKVWHFCNIMESEIGENCSFGQNVFVGKDVKLGNNCRVQNNVSIYAGITAEDNVFFGPSSVFTNDKNPRAKYSKNGQYMKTYIEEGVSIGANATIMCGIRIGKHSLIGAGAVVTKDVEPYSVMIGNPAKRVKEIDEYGNMTSLNN
jgi:acetyltransferase-like isoleucine patch superfamily enzyme